MYDKFFLQKPLGASNQGHPSKKSLISWVLVVALVLTACEKEERIVEAHPNGLKRVVHIYEGDDWTELKTFHMNNIRATRVGIKDSHMHGAFTRWSTNGVKVEQGEYHEGDSSGTWTKYLSRTEKVSEGTYVQGKKQGTWKEYWPQGIVKSESHWDQGVQVGEVREWYYDSTLQKVHNCHDNGHSKEYYYNGKIRYEYDCNPTYQRVGQFKEYDLLGHLIHQAHYNRYAQADSTWTWWNARGEILHQRQFKNGILNGPQNIAGKEIQFENGNGRLQYPCADSTQTKFSKLLTQDQPLQIQLKNSQASQGENNSKEQIIQTLIHPNQLICSDTTFVKGLPHGVSLTFEPDKFLKIESWKLGAKLWQDKYRLRNKNQLIKVSEGGFKNNLREGHWKVFNSQGKTSQKLHFEKDHYMGDQFFYDSTGVLTMKKTYQGKNQKVLVEIIDSVWRAKNLK